MKLKPCRPSLLPLKKLDWKALIPEIGQAREALARYDEQLKKATQTAIEKKQQQEATSTIHGGAKREIAFAKAALDFAILYAKRHAPSSVSFFCKVHAILRQDGVDLAEIGKIRKKQNWIGPKDKPIEEGYFCPPKAEHVPRLLANLCRYMKSRELDPLVQLAIFVGQFLIIHPFMDGNGRVARIFIPIWLWKKGLISRPAFFMSGFFESRRTAYFQKLNSITETKSWEEWIRFFLQGMAQ